MRRVADRAVAPRPRRASSMRSDQATSTGGIPRKSGPGKRSSTIAPASANASSAASAAYRSTRAAACKRLALGVLRQVHGAGDGGLEVVQRETA